MICTATPGCANEAVYLMTGWKLLGYACEECKQSCDRLAAAKMLKVTHYFSKLRVEIHEGADKPSQPH